MNWIAQIINHLNSRGTSLADANEIVFSYIESDKELAYILNCQEYQGTLTNEKIEFVIDDLYEWSYNRLKS